MLRAVVASAELAKRLTLLRGNGAPALLPADALARKATA